MTDTVDELPLTDCSYHSLIYCIDVFWVREVILGELSYMLSLSLSLRFQIIHQLPMRPVGQCIRITILLSRVVKEFE